jgi:hypothetical protein
MPVCLGLVEPSWLLLPQGAVTTKAARQGLRLLRAQVGMACDGEEGARGVR